MDRYSWLRRSRPELFVNTPGCIEILTSPEDVEKAEGVGGGPVGVAYEDAYIMLIRDAVRFPDGRFGIYLRLLPADDAPGVAVLPLLDGKAVLIEHYRHATRAWHIEIPRGFGAPEMSSEASAARELREELGAEAAELVPLGRLHPDTGMASRHVALWAARIHAVGELEKGEAIRRARPVSPTDAENMLRNGTITDSFTIAALTRARLEGLLD